MGSWIYEGWVRHRRHAPVRHAFRYRVALLYLDLDHLDTAFAGSRLFAVDRLAPARLCRRDYLGPLDQPLADAARGVVAERLGRRPDGPVFLLTHPRYFGYGFNPVSFYYCYGAGGRLDAIVADVTNTPWGQRHAYVLDAAAEPTLRFSLRKVLHVSPFSPMDDAYRWRFTPPGERLAVHMQNVRGGRTLFDATLVGTRRPMTPASLRRVLLRYPAMTVRVIAAIYWQALRLRLKGAPYHRPPGEPPPAPAGRRAP
ncbi:MAG: DUF1365 domain-containing protein [Deltaproteobacteria bacterium]|nr:MAG: DUF1365 domain-containing protein [Deltaproteobacteria bacterium]